MSKASYILFILLVMWLCILECGKKDISDEFKIEVSRPTLEIECDTADTTIDDLPVQLEIKDSLEKEIKKSEKDTTFKNTVVEKRPSVPKQSNVIVKTQKDSSSNYEGLKDRSWKYYNKSLELIGNSNDSALHYAKEAIKLYENGSLFRVKAAALYNTDRYEAAAIACDICIARNDHWDINDLKRCEELKCRSLEKVYEKYPSKESKRQYEKACGSNNTH